MKSAKNHEDRDEKGTNYRIAIGFENVLRLLWMISNDTQNCGVTKKLNDKVRFFHLVNLVHVLIFLSKTLKISNRKTR